MDEKIWTGMNGVLNNNFFLKDVLIFVKLVCVCMCVCVNADNCGGHKWVSDLLAL